MSGLLGYLAARSIREPGPPPASGETAGRPVASFRPRLPEPSEAVEAAEPTIVATIQTPQPAASPATSRIPASAEMVNPVVPPSRRSQAGAFSPVPSDRFRELPAPPPAFPRAGPDQREPGQPQINVPAGITPPHPPEMATAPQAPAATRPAPPRPGGSQGRSASAGMDGPAVAPVSARPRPASAPADAPEPRPLVPAPPPAGWRHRPDFETQFNLYRPPRQIAAATETRAGRSQRAAAPNPSGPPHVQVTIGRVEIRAAYPAPVAPAAPARPSPAMSLDDYLARREKG